MPSPTRTHSTVRSLPFSQRNTYLLRPSSGRPSLSAESDGYTASCAKFMPRPEVGGGAIFVVHPVGAAAGGVYPLFAAFACRRLAQFGAPLFPIGRPALERLPNVDRRRLQFKALAAFEADALSSMQHRIGALPR